MTDLSSLIERIEKSEGASLVLDRDIALTQYPDARPLPNSDARISIWDGNGRTLLTVKPYTASIDAAMTLVEPRALWAHGSMEDGPFARICWPRPDGTFTDSYFETNCATVPLSICACALEARNPSHEG